MTLAGIVALLLLQESAPPAPVHKPDFRVAGALELNAAVVDGPVAAFRSALNGLPMDDDSDAFFSGRLGLRAEIEPSPLVRVRLELENQPYSDGEHNGFGSDSAGEFVEQAYVDLLEFLDPTLSLRFGLQDVRLRLRPDAGAFFLDVAESESFFTGYATTATGSFVRATADRDLGETAGLRLLWEPEPYLLVHAYAGAAGASGLAPADEPGGLFYLYGNLWIPERLSSFVLAALMTDPGTHGRVFTTGLGVDWYRSTTEEHFLEAYYQAGLIDSATDKSAWAFQAGSRSWHGRFFREVSFSFRSGDEDPADDLDTAFQSCESENRYLLVESAEFGLDLDTNLESLRIALGFDRVDLGGSFNDVGLRLDVGRFRFLETPVDATGAKLLATGSRDVGTEVDLTFSWTVAPSTVLSLRVGALLDSDALDRLTPEGDSHAAAGVFGATVRF